MSGSSGALPPLVSVLCLAALTHACNALWGVDELEYGAGGTSASSPNGGTTSSSSSGGSTTSTTATVGGAGAGAMGGATTTGIGGTGAWGGAGGVAGAGGASSGPLFELYYSPENSSELYAYDSVGDEWVQRSSSPLDTTAMTAQGGHLYAKSSSSNNSAMYRYDPASDDWTTVTFAPCSSSCASSAARLVGSDLHVYYFVQDTELHRYDPGSNGWTLRADLPVAKDFGDLFEYADGYLYHLSDSTRELRRYSISSNSWSDVLATFPTATYGYRDLQNVAGLLYAVRGQANAQVFDPVSSEIILRWLEPAEIMAYHPGDARSYVWSGLGGGGSMFRSCDLAAETSVVLATPPHAIESHAFAFIPLG